MTRLHRRIVLMTLSGLALLAMNVSALRAQPSSIADFVGSFAGTGVAETCNDIYAPESVRDLDVMIEAAGSGLSVTWTTVVRSVGGKAKYETQTLSFSATGAGSQYWSDALTDPFGHGVAWAGIEDQTLSVFALNIDTDGGYQLQRYARTLDQVGHGHDLHPQGGWQRFARGEGQARTKQMIVELVQP